MATKKRSSDRRAGSAPASRRNPGGTPSTRPGRFYLAVVLAIAAVAVVAGVGFAALGGLGKSSAPGAPATTAATAGQTVVQGQGGSWTNVTPDRLAQMLTSKDFTLLNVKTPYSHEINGTDLYIPYNQLLARAAELPANKSARILVYCLTGRSSEIAAQTLLDLGYTDVWNLDTGMNGWQASGRTLVDKHR
jgi:rhodanese-related sulfurtransferase